MARTLALAARGLSLTSPNRRAGYRYLWQAVIGSPKVEATGHGSSGKKSASNLPRFSSDMPNKSAWRCQSLTALITVE